MSAATPTRDTDSSVEEDPAAGRSVDRASRHGRSRARRDRRWTLVDQRRGGEPPPERSEHARKGGADSGVDRLLEQSLEARPVHGHRRRKPMAGRGPRRPSAHREVRSGRESHSRATGDTTRSRRTPLPLVGQPIDGGTDGAPERKPIAERRTGSTTPGGWRHRWKRRDRQRRTEPLEPAPRPRTGSEGSPSTTARSSQATNGRRGAGRSDAARLPTRSKPSQGGSASGDDGPGPRSFGFDDRSARNLANPDPVPAATCREP